MRGGRLLGDVGLGGEGGRLATCSVLRRPEGDEADDLEPAGRRRRRGDPGAAVPAAVGIEDDIAGLAHVLEVQGGGEELRAQLVGPAPVGRELLGRLGGEAGDETRLGWHEAALYEPRGRAPGPASAQARAALRR